MPEGAKEGAVKIQKAVSSLPASCKMVERENLHVSLSFLGEASESGVAGVGKALKGICRKYGAFEAAASKIKIIPNESYVRVVALDTGSESGTLEKISSEIKEGVGGSAKPPHITLCRVRRMDDKRGFLDGIKKIGDVNIRFAVDSISIIRSDLSPSGPTYSIVKKINLGSG